MLLTPVTPDIYNWERTYASTKERLKNDQGILEQNRAKILAFLQTREVRGLSTPRIVKYANHLIVAARLCPKSFEAMSKEDVTELLINLKNREKQSRTWTQRRGTKYAENTLSDVKTILKIFWRWLKNMDEFKPIYPPEVNWFTKGKSRGITVTRSDLLTQEEVDLLAEAAGDAQDAAFIKVLDDAGGRISEILTLRIKDAQPRPYGFKLDVWVSKTFSHPIPIAKSAPALARWLSLHPFRDNPEAPLWLNSQRRQMLYGAARKRIQSAIRAAEARSGGRSFGKRVWFHLFRHTSATEFMRKGKGAPAVMNKKYGWSNGSDMWSVYAHMVDEDVEEAVARADAQEDQAKSFLEADERARRPKKCGRCESINDASSKFCSRCAFPLDEQVVLEVYKAEEKKSEADALLSRLMKDERVRNVISEILSEISLKQVSQEIASSSPKRRPMRLRP